MSERTVRIITIVTSAWFLAAGVFDYVNHRGGVLVDAGIATCFLLAAILQWTRQGWSRHRPADRESQPEPPCAAASRF